LVLAKPRHKTKKRDEDASKLNPPFNVVILADVVAGCYQESFPSLIASFVAVTDAKTKILP